MAAFVWELSELLKIYNKLAIRTTLGGNASADFSGRGFSLSSEVMMRYWTVFNALRASGSMMSISSFYKKVCVVQWDKVVGI